MTLNVNKINANTVKPVMRDHCNDRLTSNERPMLQ